MFALTQHISVPTHNNVHTLDLVISKGLDISITGILGVGISDHLSIFFNVAWPAKLTSGQKNIFRRNIGEETLKEFITAYIKAAGSYYDLSQVSVANLNLNFSTDFICDNVGLSSDCGELVKYLNASVTQIMDSIAPIQLKSVSRKQRINTFKRTCRKFLRKWRKTKSQVDFMNFKSHLLMYNCKIKKA